jgi:hypothetical protein
MVKSKRNTARKSASAEVAPDKARPNFKANFKAAITEQELLDGEKAAQKWGVTRRIAYTTLARSADQILAGMNEETAEALLDAANNIGKNLK